LKLYSNYLNSAGQRVRIALALKSLDYKYIAVGKIGWDAYQKINPQRLMPALAVDGQIIPQATAILEYLEESFPDHPLLPADPLLRARARGFAQFITSEMHAVDVISVRRFLSNDLGVPQSGLDRWHQHWFRRGFTALEALLTARETPWQYCFSDEPGWADIHLVPQVQKGLSRFNLDMTPYPLLASVYQRCAGQAAFIAATPEQQPDYPGRLSEPSLERSDDPARL